MKQVDSIKVTHFAILFLIASIIGCQNEDWVEPFPDRLDISLVDSIGLDVGDSSYVFGCIADADFGSDGRIYVLDQATQCIRIYTEHGEFLRYLSRGGYGPGELSLPTELVIFTDGSIGVLDPWKQAIVFLENEGESISDDASWSLMPPVCLSAIDAHTYAACQFEANISGAMVSIIIVPSSFTIGCSDANMEFHRDTLVVDPERLGSSALSGLSGHAMMSSNCDNVICYSLRSPDDYSVHVWTTDGSEVYTASLPIVPVRKTEADVEEELQLLQAKFAAYGISSIPSDIEVDTHFPLVVNLGIDSADNLWVQRGTENTPVFDVFNCHGIHCGTVVLPGADRNWVVKITPYGALAWDSAAEEAQKLYILQLPEI